jgi:hypothetical protein
MLHLDIDKLSARRADRVVVAVRHSVETAGAVAELYLSDVAGLFQKSQSYRRSRNEIVGSISFAAAKTSFRGQVRIRLANRPKDDLTLPRQT